MSAALIGILAAAGLFALFGVGMRLGGGAGACDGRATGGGCGACALFARGECTRAHDEDGTAAISKGTAMTAEGSRSE